ncbi:microtubule-destabilizing protein 60 isoform X3 [Lactuca sativa]|uniref:microtubule-destabilizing protein 60 isoform X3 n=1 Tax=Lactuca sativa TaxID=4236 RepID=UPI000CBC0B8C|nr:microtubule-destabilizing protein 60 isoform X3 [Lactuca sativa]
METPRIKTSHKYVKNTSYSSDAVRSPTRPVKSDPSSLPIKTKTSVITTKTSIKENMKPEYVKFQTLAKENTKSMEVKLQTKERAVKRAFFNYSIATKLYLMEQQKRQIEKIQKMIEEEEVRMLRKEMIPRAQLMPLFDRPFFPRRSTTPTKAAKKSSSQETHRNSFSCAQEFYNFRENEAR